MRILVVGGGITGLYNSLILSQADHDITIVEKTPFLGGQLRTLKYEYNGESFYFDLGPHIPPKEFKIWTDLCQYTSNINLKTPIESTIRLNDFDLNYPFTLKDLRNYRIFSLIKFLPSYIQTKIVKREESNLQDSLINSWSKAFYETYLKLYMKNFWKINPRFISKEYISRVSAPNIKNMVQFFIQNLLDSNNQNLKYQNRFYTYPKYGIGAVLEPLINRLQKNDVNIMTETVIKSIKNEN